MSKPLAIALITTLLTQAPLQATPVGTCASNCGPGPIEFVPGQQVRIEVRNQTASLILLERVQGTDPIPLRPGQTVSYFGWGGTKPNVSIVFWDATSLPLIARLSQPKATTLRINLVPGGRPPGDRSVYINNNGRVSLF